MMASSGDQSMPRNLELFQTTSSHRMPRWMACAVLPLCVLSIRTESLHGAQEPAAQSPDRNAGATDSTAATKGPPDDTWYRTAYRICGELESDDEDRIRAAELELHAIRNPDAVAGFERYFHRLRYRARIQVVRWLGTIETARSTTFLVRVLVSDVELIRVAIVEILKRRPAERPHYERLLLEALQTRNPDIIDHAAWAAKELECVQLIPALAKAVSIPTPPVGVRESPLVHQALVVLTGQDLGFNPERWLQWWYVVRQSKVRPDLTQRDQKGDATGAGADRAEAREPIQPGNSDANRETALKTMFRLFHWLESGNAELTAQAEAEISQIRDPEFVPLIAEWMPRGVPATRSRFIHVLASIDDPRATVVLARQAVQEFEQELRQLAIEMLAQRPHHAAEYQQIFLSGLRSRKREWIANSAQAIQQLRVESLTYALIEALYAPTEYYSFLPVDRGVLMQTEKAGMISNPRREFIPIRNDRKIKHPAVLEALVALTGVDFGFDQPAWEHWWRARAANLKESADKTNEAAAEPRR